MSTLNVLYSPDSDLSYGCYHCQECDSSFYGGGEALHRKSCSNQSYEGLDYIIGLKVFTRIMLGEDRINPITVEDLERCLPEMVRLYREKESRT